jgi:hypothetical protein
VTNKSNGHNVLQTNVINLLHQTIRIILHDKSADNPSEYVDATAEEFKQSRISLIQSLLEYGCDPNRGLVLANKKKHIISNHLYLIEEAKAHDKHSIVENETLLNDSNKSEISTLIKQNTNMPPVYSDSDESSSIMPTEAHLAANAELTHQKLNEMNTTPIDTPLLVLCCVYNCHNLLNIVKENEVFLENKNKLVMEKSDRLNLSYSVSPVCGLNSKQNKKVLTVN